MRISRSLAALALVGAVSAVGAPAAFASPAQAPSAATAAVTIAAQPAASAVADALNAVNAHVANGQIQPSLGRSLRADLQTAVTAQAAGDDAAATAALFDARETVYAADLSQIAAAAGVDLLPELDGMLGDPAGYVRAREVARNLLQNGDIAASTARRVVADLKAAEADSSRLPALRAYVAALPGSKADAAGKAGLANVLQTLQLGSPQSSSGVTVRVTNSTGVPLTLVSTSKPYGDWSGQFPQTLQPGDTAAAGVSSFSIEGAQLQAVYAAPDGTRFDVSGYVPLAGSNSTSQSVTGTNAGSYTIDHSIGSGWHPTASFNLRPKASLGAVDSSSGVTVKITNSTGKDLTRASEYKPYGDWTTEFPTTIPAGATVTAKVDSFSIEGAIASADYVTADGTRFTAGGYVPLAGSNSTSQGVSGTNASSYTIDHSIGSGWHPTASFTLRPKASLGAVESSSGVTVKIVNNTGKDLTRSSEYKPYGSWTTEFPATLPAGGTATAVVDSFSIEGAIAGATYVSADGTSFSATGYVPFAGSNSTSQDVSGTNAGSYTVDHHIDGGWHPTATFTLRTR
ncbi:hypothetical protein [Motilibacter deserti]|uniref:Uncharacterized protein n=1 Tax=Motilibacter deserti TaxID=2714956 RepID=A0ABX0H1L1_9ACTN|nr:hypothetical protein [Motilibacter deserti]NHC15924.1 hypothetical protein [Motilibacter deserti]